jgi:metal-dependent hydrolase (beta-lactamase superfamily II)
MANTPAALAYLRRLGVDASKSVKRIVATHWHNDHVRGLSQIVAECQSAKFICSQAIWSEEFIALTELWKGQPSGTSPVTEFTSIIETISRSPAMLKGSQGESPLGFAIANRLLWRRVAPGKAEMDTSAELRSLSPSDAAVRQSLERNFQGFLALKSP